MRRLKATKAPCNITHRIFLALLPQQMSAEVAWTHRDPLHEGALQQALGDGVLSTATAHDQHVIAATDWERPILQCCGHPLVKLNI